MYMMNMGAHILSKIPYTLLLVNKSTRNQIWNPTIIAAVTQFSMRTTMSQVFNSIVFISYNINIIADPLIEMYMMSYSMPLLM